ncbi:MAG TPA: hypothetical protein PLS63_07095, partial [Microthrixaceae bacterium]|nr:hypothetical protein [Microthrixaceae bacterium]
MRSSGLRLGRIFGVDVAADLGVLVFAGLLTWILATSVLPTAESGLAGSAYWSVAALGTLLFIGSLLAHELGHAVFDALGWIADSKVSPGLFDTPDQQQRKAYRTTTHDIGHLTS